MGRPTKVLILSNEIAPYRVPVFNRLADNKQVDIEVLFCTERIRERHWEIRKDRRFRNAVVPGVDLRLPKGNYSHEVRTIHVNPTLIIELVRRNPDVVVAMEFSLPALTAFAYCKAFGKKYISWSSGTMHSERHNSRAQNALRRLIIPKSDACIGVSSAAREKYISFGAEPERTFVGIQTVAVAWI